MRVKLPRVLCNDQGAEETVTDVITLDKNHRHIEHLGWTLAEATQLLSPLQRHLRQQQGAPFLDACTTGPDCGTPLTLKARAHRSFRPVFGPFKLCSPRLAQCDCKRRQASSFRPRLALLTASVAPALLSMEAKWASLVSYGMRLDALQDLLPLDRTLDGKTVRYATLKVAKRLEAELGDEHACFIDGSPSAWVLWPPPEGAFTMGMDGGYVRNGFDKQHNCAVIVGKSVRSFGAAEDAKSPSHKRLGFVQTLDTQAKRRLYAVLPSQGVQRNQAITFLSDGDDTLRKLQWEMRPLAPHLVDWFHWTRRLTGLDQYGKGLVQCEAGVGAAIRNQSERLTGSLWQGQVDKALGKIDDLELSIEPCHETSARFSRWGKAWSELRTSIGHTRHVIPHEGERYHHGATIATGVVESTVHEVMSKRCCTKHQRQWSKAGAHVLLQTRVRTLNGELGAIFKRWYPDMDLEAEAIPVAA